MGKGTYIIFLVEGQGIINGNKCKKMFFLRSESQPELTSIVVTSIANKVLEGKIEIGLKPLSKIESVNEFVNEFICAGYGFKSCILDNSIDELNDLQEGEPLFTEIEQIPKDIDLACVVLRSGVLGGNGSLLAKELLNRNINVIQEQPIHKSDMTECIRIARKNKLVFMTCDLYVHLPAVKAFIESAAKLLKQQKALYIEASCSTQVSYPLIDILSQIFHTMKPWSINFVNRESGPFHVATGKISDIPVIYQINNEIDPDDPDNYMHLLQKITIGTEGGHLALEDMVLSYGILVYMYLYLCIMIKDIWLITQYI